MPEESTFVHRLELALQQRPLPDGPIAEVQNHGISGFGSPHHLQSYRHRARRHGPRLVVLCAFLFNDVWDSGLTDPAPLRPRFRLGPGGEIAGLEPFQAPPPQPPSLLRRWLGRSAAGLLLLGLHSPGRQGLHPAAPTYEANWRPSSGTSGPASDRHPSIVARPIGAWPRSARSSTCPCSTWYRPWRQPTRRARLPTSPGTGI